MAGYKDKNLDAAYLQLSFQPESTDTKTLHQSADVPNHYLLPLLIQLLQKTTMIQLIPSLADTWNIVQALKAQKLRPL